MKFELEKNVMVKKIYSINSFEISSINIKPNISANLDIIFYCNDQLHSNQYLLKRIYIQIGKLMIIWIFL